MLNIKKNWAFVRVCLLRVNTRRVESPAVSHAEPLSKTASLHPDLLWHFLQSIQLQFPRTTAGPACQTPERKQSVTHMTDQSNVWNKTHKSKGWASWQTEFHEQRAWKACGDQNTSN